jgi:hypothetical protein
LIGSSRIATRSSIGFECSGKTYGRLRDEHLQTIAAKVNFSKIFNALISFHD